MHRPAKTDARREDPGTGQRRGYCSRDGRSESFRRGSARDVCADSDATASPQSSVESIGTPKRPELITVHESRAISPRPAKVTAAYSCG